VKELKRAIRERHFRILPILAHDREAVLARLDLPGIALAIAPETGRPVAS
jgi:hypothetical protein